MDDILKGQLFSDCITLYFDHGGLYSRKPFCFLLKIRGVPGSTKLKERPGQR